MEDQNYKNKYEIIEKMSSKEYEEVYKVKNKINGELNALKVIDLFTIKSHFEDEADNILNEIKNSINIMKIFGEKNENSLKFYESFETEKEFVIVTELYDESLSNIIKKNKKENKGFNLKEINVLLNQLNNTFKIMKKNNIIHRNLNPDNILVKYGKNNEFIIKLNGNDLYKNLINTDLGSPTIYSINAYSAPEIINMDKIDYKCDLWSLGIIIYELFFMKRPYNAYTKIALFNKIMSGKIELKKTKDEYLDDLISKLLEKDPGKRLTWDEYFNHPFFNDKLNKKVVINEESSKEKENEKSTGNKENNGLNYTIIKDIWKVKNKELYLVLYDNNKLGKKNYLLLKIELESEKEKSQLCNRIKMINSIKSKYSIKIYNLFFEKENQKEKACLLINNYENGNLESKIYKKQGLNSIIIWRIFIQLAIGIKSFHSDKIIIKNLTPQNIFIDNEQNIRIWGMGDLFDFNKETYEKSFNLYSSPEVLKGQEFDFKCDIWSLGCILYELLFKKKAFESEDCIKNIKYEINECEKEFKTILKKLLCIDKNRIKINELFNDMNFKAKLIEMNLFDEIIKDNIKGKF